VTTCTPRPAWWLFAILAAVTMAVSGTGCGQDSSGAEPDGPRNGSDVPVVLIVLDELPTANLMTRDGRRINAKRFPEIARFASRSTWYRDNVAAGDFTAWAVPPILTGNLADQETLPTADVQPDNIFTLLGPGRKLHVLEPVTELCPRSLCSEGGQGGAEEEEFADDFVKAKFHPFRTSEANEWIRGIPAGPGTLVVGHIETPHQPLRFTPDGKLYRPGVLAMPTDLKLNGWTTGEPAVAFVQGRHLIQTGFADRIVGKIMRRIRRNGDWDRSLVILTADHGNSFDPDDLRRDVTRTNPGATVNPPLFIKYPGQTEGEVSTASTQSIDILPTIAEVLGADIPETDGRPVGEARPDRVMKVSKDEMRHLEISARDVREDRRGVLADQYRRLGGGGLWHLGPRPGLIGTRIAGLPSHEGATYRPGNDPRSLRQADSSNAVVPSLVYGRLTGVPEGRVIAVAWNGRVVATTRAFAYRGRIWFGAMVPPSVMRKGRNRVEVLERGSDGRLRRIPRS
jgi:hypothetical protein